MADITNGQVVGTASKAFNCGFLGTGTCYRYYTYRVRKFKNRLLITYTYTSRDGNTPGELVMNEQQTQEAQGDFTVDFRQSELFPKLAKQAVLSGEGIGSGETQLSSTYTTDNETVLRVADFNPIGPVITDPNKPKTDTGTDDDTDDDDNGLTLDQLLPYIAGAVVLLGLAFIMMASRRK